MTSFGGISSSSMTLKAVERGERERTPRLRSHFPGPGLSLRLKARLGISSCLSTLEATKRGETDTSFEISIC